MVETINMEEGVKLNGAAFCIAPGYFISCAHVIRKYNKNTEKSLDVNEIAATTKVSLVRKNSRFPAEIFVLDAINDIAIIKSSVECDSFEFDKSVIIGDEILTIGSPHGFENNISFGTVGGVKRKIYTYANAPEYIFVDLSAFSGNSGGPIVKESNGKVIGMLTAIVTNSGEYGLNAGLPAKYIEELCIINKII